MITSYGHNSRGQVSQMYTVLMALDTGNWTALQLPWEDDLQMKLNPVPHYAQSLPDYKQLQFLGDVSLQ